MIIYHIMILCQVFFKKMSGARKLSGLIAHDLSGLLRSPPEVTDEADSVSGGDPEDAIRRGLFGMERESVDPGAGGTDLVGMRSDVSSVHRTVRGWGDGGFVGQAPDPGLFSSCAGG